MNQQELNAILDNHKKWLNDEDGGVRANLRGADLSGADLIGANLSGANLIGANLKYADLSGADLIDADLIGANLRCANLRGADLSRANLRGADLSRANLSGVVGNSSRVFSMQTNKWAVVIDVETKIMQIGCQQHSIVEWNKFDDDEIKEFDNYALDFWNMWKEQIFSYIEKIGG